MSEAADREEEPWHKHAILADASYRRNTPVEGYEIDSEFSDRNRTVYVKDGKAHIAFRGTQLSGEKAENNKWRDLGADALIALGLQDLSARFRGSLAVTKKVAAKYGGAQNVVLTGHSLGGAQALFVNSRMGAVKPETHAFNPGVSPIDVARSKGLFGPQHARSLFNKRPVFENATGYITRGDLVSALAPHLPNLPVKMVPLKPRKRPHALAHFLP